MAGNQSGVPSVILPQVEIIHCEMYDVLLSYPQSAGVFCKFPSVISP